MPTKQRNKRKERTARKKSLPKARLEGSCEGVDCSRYWLTPFAQSKLVSIDPKPAEEDEKRAELDAKVAFEDYKTGFYKLIKELNREGNLVGVFWVMAIRGFGGDEICKGVSKRCKCEPDMSNPSEIWEAPPVKVKVPFTFKEVKYTAKFEVVLKLNIVHGHCTDPDEFF